MRQRDGIAQARVGGGYKGGKRRLDRDHIKALRQSGEGSAAISPDELWLAVRATEEEQQRAFRTAFIPDAVIVTEREVPSQITLCTVTRGHLELRVALACSQPRATFTQQALSEVNRRTDGGRREFPFFGAPLGFVVNYDWCRAVRYELEGQATQLLGTNVRVGKLTWAVG